MRRFEIEPLPEAHPFWRHDRILVTPHVACIPTPEAVVRNVRETMLAAKETA